MTLQQIQQQTEEAFREQFLNEDKFSSVGQFKTELQGRLPDAFLSFLHQREQVAWEAGRRENAIAIDKHFGEFLQGDGTKFSREIREKLIAESRRAAIEEVVALAEGEKQTCNHYNSGCAHHRHNATIDTLLAKLKELSK